LRHAAKTWMAATSAAMTPHDTERNARVMPLS
jgi:hypothetical protein